MRLISEADIPALPADPITVSQSSSEMVAAMKTSSQQVTDMLTRWGQLNQCLQTVETPQLIAALGPVRSAADQWQTAIDAVSKAMDDYATELSGLKPSIDTLHAKIPTFRKEMDSYAYTKQLFPNPLSPADDRTIYGPYYEQNAAYLDDCDALRRKIQAVSDQCAADLSRVGIPTDVLPSIGTPGAPTTMPTRADFESFLGQQLLNSLASKVGPDGDSSALKDFLNRNPDFVRKIEATGVDPTAVRSWWQSLNPALAAALLLGGAKVTGALNGMPANDRVAANKQNAQDRLDAIADRPDSDPEKRYLLSVIAGDRKLYLYDGSRDRIIEMIGNPDTATRVITWVPGTTADMNGFYNGGQQAPAQYLTTDGNTKGTPTVAFVYKDGPWATFGSPWDQRSNANKAWMMDRSVDLAAFEKGVRSDPHLNSAQHVILGHSAGLSIVTGAEVQGAHFDQVHSLSGSWIADGWKPQTGTQYHTYQRTFDAINTLDLIDTQSPLAHVIDDVGTPATDGHWAKHGHADSSLPAWQWGLATAVSPLGMPVAAVVDGVNNHINNGAGGDLNGAILDDLYSRLDR